MPQDRTPRAQKRLFVALWPDAATREALREHQRLWRWSRGAAPTRPERLHLTLHFLGSQPAALLPALEQGLQVPFEPFELRLDDAGLWQRNGIAKLGSREPPPELVALYERLAAVLVALGLQPESRRFDAHVTLARYAKGSRPPAAAPAIAWPVAGYALMESDPGPPAEYKVLRSYG